MTDYDLFKTKVSTLIDGHLLKYRPIPDEFVDRIRTVLGGDVEITNSIGEVTHCKKNVIMSVIDAYHKQIKGIIDTCKMIQERTAFGWFILTKSNLLSMVDNKIQTLGNTGKYILALVSLHINESLLCKSTNFERLVCLQQELKQFIQI